MVDQENIQRLAEIHIRRYSDMIRCGASNVCVDECINYLEIWKSIKQKGEWDKLIKEERWELMDAVEDEKL